MLVDKSPNADATRRRKYDRLEARISADGDESDLLWPMRVTVYKRTKLIELLHTLDGQPPSTLPLTALIGRNLGLFKRVVGYRFGGTSGRVSQDRYWRRLDSLAPPAHDGRPIAQEKRAIGTDASGKLILQESIRALETGAVTSAVTVWPVRHP